MPLLKPIYNNRQQIIKTTSGTVILKMYKYFKDLVYKKKKGCYITRVLLDSGYIYERTTLGKPARNKPGLYREREWHVKGYADESMESLRYTWYGEGWILPKGFWVGPQELKPHLVKKHPELKDEPDEWLPERLKVKERKET